MIPDLGRGAAEVLTLGCEEKEPLLIIDNALARKLANLIIYDYRQFGSAIESKKSRLFKTDKSITFTIEKNRFLSKR